MASESDLTHRRSRSGWNNTILVEVEKLSDKDKAWKAHVESRFLICVI